MLKKASRVALVTRDRASAFRAGLSKFVHDRLPEVQLLNSKPNDNDLGDAVIIATVIWEGDFEGVLRRAKDVGIPVVVYLASRDPARFPEWLRQQEDVVILDFLGVDNIGEVLEKLLDRK